MERIYTLTDLGKKSGSHISPNGRDDLIDYMYSHGTVRLSEVASLYGGDERKARHVLRPYLKRGLVQELTRND